MSSAHEPRLMSSFIDLSPAKRGAKASCTRGCVYMYVCIYIYDTIVKRLKQLLLCNMYLCVFLLVAGGLNSGPPICLAGTVSRESHSYSFLLLLFFR
jgi:hypothetical protein